MEDFQFEIELETRLEKAGDGRDRRLVGGICTTDALDQQGEVVLQEGLDFGPFLKKGYLNWDHDAQSVVGVPTKAELRELPAKRKGWYIEAELLEGVPDADRIWSIANALQKTDRRLGFSVEGKILQRSGEGRSVIRRALVKEVAVTKSPVNGETALQVLVKSLTAAEDESPVTAKMLSAGSAAGEALQPEALERRRLTKADVKRLLRTLKPDLEESALERIATHAVRNHPAADGGKR